MAIAPWETLSSNTLFEIPQRIRVDVEAVKLPDGRVVDDYLQVRMHSFAVVYATTADDKVICITQYKHGPRRASLTLPAGHAEEGEHPLAAARRELLEETGFEGQDYRLLASLTVNGNQGCGTAHIVRATMCRKVTEPVVHDLEDMTIELLDRKALQESLLSGKVAIVSHAAAIGLGLLAI